MMKLQTKVLAILAFIWIITCVIIYMDAKIHLVANYDQQEQKLGYTNIARAKNAIKNKLDALILYTNSWSQWDEAYDYLVSRNKKFETGNFLPGTFTSSNINFFYFSNAKGQFYSGATYDSVNDRMVNNPEKIIAYLNSHPHFVTHDNPQSKRAGFLTTLDGIIVMSSLPVIRSDGNGPIHGSLMMGYYLTDKFFADIAKTIDLDITFYPTTMIDDNPLLKTIRNKLTTNDYLDTSDAKTGYGYSLINDIDGNPIGMLKITLPRALYLEGITTINHFLIIILIVAAAVSLTMWFALKKMVLNRIIDVSERVININKDGSFNNRITIAGNDEISHMTNALNSMLELIELTQDQLRYRISRRTKELEKLSNLNRNLFGEINKHKTIETKLREDEKLLKQMAYYDTLTGLPNRAFFRELLHNSIAHAGRENYHVAVIFIDCDKFKKINDTYGHDFGDKFLRVISHRLQKAIRKTDIAARLAGDEFVIFLTDIRDLQNLDILIKQIIDTLSETIDIDLVKINPSFSLGISIYPNDGETIDALLNQADLAMYYAKKNEGQSYFYYSQVANQKDKTE